MHLDHLILRLMRRQFTGPKHEQEKEERARLDRPAEHNQRSRFAVVVAVSLPCLTPRVPMS